MKTNHYKTARKLAQEKAVRKIEHFKGRALLADEMRIGKTFITMQWLIKNPKIRPAIIICPEIGKWHWEKVAKGHFGIRGAVLNGFNPPRKKQMHKNQLYFLNWEILPYWVNYLKKLKPKALILDECHYIKNSKTACYKATKELANKLPHIIAIGGTPLKSRPVEMFNVLNLIRPDKYPSLIQYGFRYCQPKLGKRGDWEFKGAAHLDELHKNLNAWCMIRRLRKAVFDDPPKDRHIIPIPISNKKEYEEAENNFIQWLSKHSATRAKKAKKAKRLIQMGYLKRLAATSKMPYVKIWIDEWLKSKKGKLAIFCIHKNIIKELKDRYKNICVVVDGSIRGKKRQLAVKTFQKNKKCKLFIGNTKAAGTVIELSKAKAMVGIEMDWTPGDLTQAEDRIYKQGGKDPLLIYYLVAKNTIEHKLCKILQSKQNVLSNVLDGSKKKNQLSVYDMLEKALLKQKNKTS